MFVNTIRRRNHTCKLVCFVSRLSHVRCGRANVRFGRLNMQSFCNIINGLLYLIISPDIKYNSVMPGLIQLNQTTARYYEFMFLHKPQSAQTYRFASVNIINFHSGIISKSQFNLYPNSVGTRYFSSPAYLANGSVARFNP